MTPKKLVTWYAPFFAIDAFVILCGPLTIAVDAAIAPRLTGWAAALLGTAHSVFVLGFLWLAWQAARRFPVATIRRAIFALMGSYLYLGVEGILVATGHGTPHPFLISEMLASVAIWFALDTARHASV